MAGTINLNVCWKDKALQVSPQAGTSMRSLDTFARCSHQDLRIRNLLRYPWTWTLKVRTLKTYFKPVLCITVRLQKNTSGIRTFYGYCCLTLRAGEGPACTMWNCKMMAGLTWSFWCSCLLWQLWAVGESQKRALIPQRTNNVNTQNTLWLETLPGHRSWEKTDILKLVCAVLSNGPVNQCPLGALSRHHSGLPAPFSPGLSILSFHTLWLKAEVLSFQQLFLPLTPVWHMIEMVFVLLEHKTMTCQRWGPILYCMEVWMHLVPKHIHVKTHRG